MENGMTQADAERSARCDFGNPTLIEERSREIWQWSMFETTCADLGYAARKLRKSQAFTITCLLTLAWESALTLPYSAPPTILFYPLPYRDQAAWFLSPRRPHSRRLTSTSPGQANHDVSTPLAYPRQLFRCSGYT